MAIIGPDGFFLDLANGESVGPLAVGESQTVVRQLDLFADPGEYTVVAVVDPLAEIVEVSEANNRATATANVLSAGGPTLDITTDRPLYRADENVLTTVEILGGGESFTGELALSVEDDAGFLVASLGTRQVVDLGLGEVQTETAVWNTGPTFAGPYRVRAILMDSTESPAIGDFAPFDIFGESELVSTVATDAASYPLGATATLVGGFEYGSGNQPVAGAESALQVVAEDGTVVIEWTQSLGTLLPGATGSMTRAWPGAAPVGTYTAVFEVRRVGEVLARSESLFQVTTGLQQVAGQLTLPAIDPEVGEDFLVGWQVQQLSGASIPQLLVRLSLVDPDGFAVLQQQQLTADLGPASGSVVFPTGALDLGPYLVVLEGAVPAATPMWLTLDTGPFNAVDRTPPVVTIQTPPGGGFLAADLVTEVQARDSLAGVELVELQLDGGPWQPMFFLTGDVYTRLLESLAEGAHTLLARATDRSGNLGLSQEVSFLVDLTPPEILITGVVDGETYSDPVTPLIEIIELYPASESINLNSATFVSGTEVSETGTYQLVVLAEDQAGNSSQAVVTFTLEQRFASLTASKTDQLASDNDGDSVPSPGDELRYEVVIENVGEAAATALRFLDALPAHTSLVPGSLLTSAGSVISQDPVTVDLGELSASNQVTMEFRVVVDDSLPDGVREISNQGTVSSSELPDILTDDPDLPGSEDPTVTALVLPGLAASKTVELAADADGDSVPSPGDQLLYEILLSNSGDTASSVLLEDAIPAFTTLVPGSVTTSAGSVSSEDPITIDVGTLASAATVTVQFRVEIDDPLPDGVGEISNQGTVSRAGGTPFLTDDPDLPGSEDPTVIALVIPELAASKTVELAVDADGNSVPSPGDELRYEIVLSNSGDVASAVVFEDPIPAFTLLVPDSVVTSAGSVTSEDPITIEVGALDAGATVTVQFRVVLDNPWPVGVGQVVNQGTVSRAGGVPLLTDDPAVPGVNDATVLPVTALAVLAATKVDSLFDDVGGDGQASPGDVLRYQIDLVNSGNTAATVVSLLDAIPANTSLEAGSVATTQGTVVSEDPIEVDLGQLTTTTAASVSFRVRIDDPVPAGIGEIVNQGTVSSAGLADFSTDDPDTAELGDATRTPLAGPLPQLSISDVLVSEGDGEAIFIVTLIGDTSETVTVLAETRDGTALAGADYQAVSTVLEFLPSTEGGSQTVAVPILGDDSQEPTETFFVDLSNPVGAVLADASAVGTIEDDDQGVALSAVKWDMLMDDLNFDGQVNAGEEVEYTLLLSNEGPGTATELMLLDEIPDWTFLVPGSVTTTAGTVTSEDPVRIAIGDLLPDQTVEIRFVVQIDPQIPLSVDTVSNQGVFSSAQVLELLTDDPDTPESDDPTLTVIWDPQVIEIPAASRFGLGSLTVFLLLAALSHLRRRRLVLGEDV